MQQWLTQQRGWLTAERLPGCAPELNSLKLVWNHVKDAATVDSYAEEPAEVGTGCRQEITFRCALAITIYAATLTA